MQQGFKDKGRPYRNYITQKLKTQKLKTFSNLGKSSTTKLKQENIAIKASQNLIIRMLIVAKMRHIDLEEVLSYSLSPVPPSLGNYHGSMVKTNKAGLLHCLLKHVPNAVVSTPPSAQTLIVAAIALIQEIQNIPKSFGLLADQILRQLFSIADRFKCRRIDFVADTYPNKSIKIQ